MTTPALDEFRDVSGERAAGSLADLFRERLAAGDTADALYVLPKGERLVRLTEWWLGGRIDDPEMHRLLPSLWSDGEPDATGLDWLAVWRAIVRRTGRIEQAPLPPGDPLTIYRGQHSASIPAGIAWTLDLDVARFFARRLGFGRSGVVMVATCVRSEVLGYVTDRNESEVVLDPSRLTPDVHETA